MIYLNSFIFVTIVACIAHANNVNSKREKRSFIVAPMGGTFKLVIGVAIPVQLGLKQTMAYGLNLQFQYALAQNVTQLKIYPPIISRTREKRQEKSNDRALTYTALESLMDRYGINGKSCMLRSICDNAMESVHSKENGLYGKIVHILLTPNYGNGAVNSGLDPSYLDAYKAGEYGVDCISLYPSCPYGHGILDIIATLIDF